MFVGLLFFIFLIIIRPQDIYPFLSDIRIVFITMFLLLGGWFVHARRELIVTLQDKYYLMFFIAIVVSTIKVKWMSYSLEVFIETFKMALIYFFIVTIVDSDRRLKITSWTIVFLMSLVALFGIMQSYGHDVMGAGMLWAGDKQLWQIRGIGLFDNPNDLAYSVVLIVPFTMGYVLCGQGFFKKIASLLLLFIAIYAIYLTHSRGGYLATAICCASWVYFSFTSKYLKRISMLVAMIGVLYAILILTQGYRGDESSMGRIYAWVEGMSLLEENPLIGVGKGQFVEYHNLDSHSSYVRAGAELGLFGLLAFVGILVSSFKAMNNPEVRLKELNWKVYNLSFLCYLISYMTGSLFSTRVYDIVFMIMIAMTSVVYRLSMENKNEVDNVQNDEILDGYSRGKVLNKIVIFYTILTIVIWKAFLMQVW